MGSFLIGLPSRTSTAATSMFSDSCWTRSYSAFQPLRLYGQDCVVAARVRYATTVAMTALIPPIPTHTELVRKRLGLLPRSRLKLGTAGRPAVGGRPAVPSFSLERGR